MRRCASRWMPGPRSRSGGWLARGRFPRHILLGWCPRWRGASGTTRGCGGGGRRRARGERDDAWLRRDEQQVAGGEDPLADTLGALAATGDAAAAARTLLDEGLWRQCLGRVWTEGTSGLDRVIRLATQATAAPDLAA